MVDRNNDDNSKVDESKAYYLVDDNTSDEDVSGCGRSVDGSSDGDTELYKDTTESSSNKTEDSYDTQSDQEGSLEEKDIFDGEVDDESLSVSDYLSELISSNEESEIDNESEVIGGNSSIDSDENSDSESSEDSTSGDDDESYSENELQEYTFEIGNNLNSECNTVVEDKLNNTEATLNSNLNFELQDYIRLFSSLNSIHYIIDIKNKTLKFQLYYFKLYSYITYVIYFINDVEWLYK